MRMLGVGLKAAHQPTLNLSLAISATSIHLSTLKGQLHVYEAERVLASGNSASAIPYRGERSRTSSVFLLVLSLRW